MSWRLKSEIILKNTLIKNNDGVFLFFIYIGSILIVSTTFSRDTFNILNDRIDLAFFDVSDHSTNLLLP